MKIYISHSGSFDYESELYRPLRNSPLNDSNELFLPHEEANKALKTKAIIEQADLLVAEVSFPSTGQGIELAWATEADTPIICLYKEGAKPSGALKFIGVTPIEYKDVNDFLTLINSKLEQG